jgi:hypothetical protein
MNRALYGSEEDMCTRCGSPSWENFAGRSWFSLFNPSWQYYDVLGLEGEILVVWHEAWCCSSCGTMWCVLESQSRTSETSRFVAAIESARMEMGRNWYGFHCGIVMYTGWLWFNMCHSGLIDQGSSLPSGEDYLHRSTIGRAVYLQDCVFAWGT